MSLKRTAFFPSWAISMGVVRGLKRYVPKLYTHNVTKVNNDQHKTNWLLLLHTGVHGKHLTKQGQPQVIFLVSNPVRNKKRHNDWVKRVNRVIVV